MLKNNLKIAWRNLLKRKGFSLINIVGLAFGFTCSILVFLFVSHHLKYDNFHENSNRIYRFVTEEHTDEVEYAASVPPGFSNAFKEDYNYAELTAKVVNRENQMIWVEEANYRSRMDEGVVFAEADLFKIFNYPMLNGSDEVPITDPNTAVISESMAKQIFGHTDVTGRSFELSNEELITITGVIRDLPEHTLIQADIFISYPTLESYSRFLGGESWGGISSDLQCFGLLYPNQNVAEIEEVIAGYVQKFRPSSKNIHHYKLQPLSEVHFSSDYSGGIDLSVLWIFSMIGFFILFIACINFINIATAQSVYRSKEVGVRKVLGGYKNHLFWQFMAEAFLVSLMALCLGVALCFLVLPYFNAVFDLNLSMSTLGELTSLAFILLLLIIVAFFAGSYPGIVLTRITPILALKGKLTQKDAGGFLTRKTLVILQFSISAALIIGTLVINKQLRYAIDSDLGFDKSAILMLEIPDELESLQINSLKERFLRSAAVEKVTACFASPGAGNNRWGTNLNYNNRPEDEEFPIQIKTADKDYLNTFNLNLVAGRNFYEKDTVDEVLVNETFVRKIGLQSPEEVIGDQLEVSGGFAKGTIVGVVADFHDRDFHENINPIFIAPVSRSYAELAVKVNMANISEVLPHIEREWSAVFPDHIFVYDFLDERVAELYEAEQQFLSLTSIFSALAILIACLGIYGLIAFLIAQKTKEIGIRKVLGSSISSILVLLTKDFLKLILFAGLLAAPIAWYFGDRWLEQFQYRVEVPWWSFGIAVGSLMMIALLTISFQAFKAARANPVKSLRTE